MCCRVNRNKSTALGKDFRNLSVFNNWANFGITPQFAGFFPQNLRLTELGIHCVVGFPCPCEKLLCRRKIWWVGTAIINKKLAA
jgi:hypothetical protein